MSHFLDRLNFFKKFKVNFRVIMALLPMKIANGKTVTVIAGVLIRSYVQRTG